MKAIVCVDSNWGLTRNGECLFNYDFDLDFVNELTNGKAVIYGANTLTHLPDNKPMKGRLNIIYAKNLADLDMEAIYTADYVFKVMPMGLINISNYIPMTMDHKLVPMKVKRGEELPAIQDIRELKISKGDTVVVLIGDLSHSLVVTNFFNFHDAQSDVYSIGSDLYIHNRLFNQYDDIYVAQSDADLSADKCFYNLDDDLTYEKIPYTPLTNSKLYDYFSISHYAKEREWARLV